MNVFPPLPLSDPLEAMNRPAVESDGESASLYIRTLDDD